MNKSCIDAIELVRECFEYSPNKFQEVKVLTTLIMFFPVSSFMN